MDGIIPAYVVREFPVWLGLVVVMGLISAGLSTLEGLIQALATTLTNDLIKPLAGRFLPPAGTAERDRVLLKTGRAVIVLLAMAAILLSRDQLLNPKLSVAIFAQNGVYAYFSAAFVPIMFGMFISRTPRAAAVAAAVTALVVHFTMYYAKLPVPGTAATGENPGVAAAVAILASLAVGAVVLFAAGREGHEVS
jgi:sodium/pantothenate symporter